jgi:putative flippase GtrA
MPLLKQFVTFFGVGVAATITDWSTFFVLTHFFGVENVHAALIAYCCGGVISYTLNRAHTFDSDRSHFEAGWRFAVVMAVGFSLTGLFVWIFADRLGLPPMAARVISTGIVFFWNYIAHKLWTFAEKRA